MSRQGIPADLEQPSTQCWPRGQPPVTPLSVWGPAPAGNAMAWYWEPRVNVGYQPILRRLSARSRNATSGVYTAAIAPQWLLAFLDPNDAATPTRNAEFQPGAALTNPLSAEVMFFEVAGVFAILDLNNDGPGWPFPMRTPDRYMGAFFSALRIGNNTEVQITPVIEYVKIDPTVQVQVLQMPGEEEG